MEKRTKISNLIVIHLVALLVIGSIDFVGVYIMWSSGVVNRLLPESEFKRNNHIPLNNAANQNDFYNLLKKNGFSKEQMSINQIISLQQFIGNSIKNVGVYFGKELSIDLFKEGASGTPLACDSMALIMNDALSALGYESRLIQLYRSDFSNTDTHVVVEVFMGEWVLFDPTFNITFENKGTLLGVNKVQELLRTKGPSKVNVIYHGDRAYPARIDNYYMDWRPLFSNAYAIDNRSTLLGKLPPFRWWYGPKKYYFGKDLLLWAYATNQICYLFIVVLPIVLALILSLLITLQLRKLSISKSLKNHST